MKKLFFLFALALFSFASCTKQDIAKGTPCQIKNHINEFKRSCCSSGARVDEYTFQGASVFVFDPGNCGADLTAEVVDENDKNLGYLGGISGNTRINGQDFTGAVYVGNTWHN